VIAILGLIAIRSVDKQMTRSSGSHGSFAKNGTHAELLFRATVEGKPPTH
jgi:hypothetical protein